MAGAATGAKNHADHAASAVIDAGDYTGQAKQLNAKTGAVFFLKDDGAQHQRP